MEPILELDHVSKSFAGFSLNNISLQLEPGYIHGCIGPNGSGKTTTIRLIMNLIPPETGTIRLFGRDMAADEKAVKNRIGFVYDEACLFEDVRPLSMKHIISKFYTNWDDKEFSRYFDLFDLPSDKALKHYSQGMKMKYVTAIALSHHAQLIIMDEPTSGLDPVSRHEILEILQNYIAEEEASVLARRSDALYDEKENSIMTAHAKNVIIPLIQKDFLLQKRTALFLLFFIFILLISVSSEGIASPYITAAVGASVFWIMSVCSYEGFYKIERLFASLPIRRSEIVYARYVSSMLTILIAIAAAGIMGWLLSILHIRPETAVISLADGAAAFLISSCLLFGYLPVYFKLGYLRSRMLNIAVFAAMGLVLAGVSFLFDAVGISLAQSLSLAAVFGLLLWAVLGFVSVRFAVRFFRQREL